jgi:hypothetical protein
MTYKFHTWLKVEHWYHLFVALGATGVVVSLSIEVKGIANAHSLLFSVGLLFLGVGEWINHPQQTNLMRPTINAPNGGVVSGHPRFNSILSLGFDLLGLALLGVALYKITQAA